MIFDTSGTNTLASSCILSNTNTYKSIVSNMRYLNEQAWTSGGNGLTRYIVSRELDFSPQFRGNRFSYSNQFRGRNTCAYARTRLCLHQRLDTRSLFPYASLCIFCWLFFYSDFFLYSHESPQLRLTIGSCVFFRDKSEWSWMANHWW